MMSKAFNVDKVRLICAALKKDLLKLIKKPPLNYVL